MHGSGWRVKDTRKAWVADLGIVEEMWARSPGDLTSPEESCPVRLVRATRLLSSPSVGSPPIRLAANPLDHIRLSSRVVRTVRTHDG